MGLSRDDAGKFLPAYIEAGILPKDPFVSLDRKGSARSSRWPSSEAGGQARLKLGVCGEHGGDPASIGVLPEGRAAYVSCSPFRVAIARLAAAQAGSAGEGVVDGGSPRERAFLARAAFQEHQNKFRPEQSRSSCPPHELSRRQNASSRRGARLSRRQNASSCRGAGLSRRQNGSSRRGDGVHDDRTRPHAEGMGSVGGRTRSVDRRTRCRPEDAVCRPEDAVCRPEDTFCRPEDALSTGGRALSTGGRALSTGGRALSTGGRVLSTGGRVSSTGGRVLSARGVVCRRPGAFRRRRDISTEARTSDPRTGAADREVRTRASGV